MSVLHRNSNTLSQDAAQHCPQSYQLEMLEESLKRNIIVAVFNVSALYV
jgi:hypothetical protein